ncbi:MAG: hypothetical protein KatS3mg004_1870 [Bryobacteraceae bacterium]|nr:MAG: hypothetical protein KatS3mg004_1870 [Bryobacteraceae bacterium]
MPELLRLFDPRRTIQLQGFSGRAATTTLHDATETGFQISGIFQAAEDFANVQLFSAYDYFNHLRLKPLPVTDLSGLTLQYDMEILPVNGEEGNVRPDCPRYASVGWDKLTITTGSGDIYEVPLMAHAQVISGIVTPGEFEFALADRREASLDALLIGKPTPALTDKVYVYFMGTRWSCSSAEAIAFCDLETVLTQDIGNPDNPSTDQAIWWQGDPYFYHNFFVNNSTVAVPEHLFASSAEIAQFFAAWFNNQPGINDLVTCSASGNVVTVTLKPGVSGPVMVWSNSGSAPTTLSRFVPGVYTARVASSAEIRAGDYVGLDIGGGGDEVVKVLSVASGSFTAHFSHRHLAGAVCRVLPRARHFGRVLKDRMVDAPAPDYGEQPSSLAVEQFTTTNTSCKLKLRLVGQLGGYGRDANGMPVRVSVDLGNQIVGLEEGGAVLATAVQGASNTRVYRFTFPFASLYGYKNGDRNSFVPVPADDIVKIHLTFAPRFEDVEAGLREGGRLTVGVVSSPPGTEEEWHLTDAEEMLAGRKYYVGTSALEERITCIANFGLIKPDPGDPATWYYRVLVRRGEDSSTPQAWPPGTRIQRISTITGTRSDIEWQVKISNLTVTGDRTLKVGGEAPRIEESDGRCRYEGYWEDYRYGAGWPTQWWSLGHAKRCAPNDAQDHRAVTIRYSYPRQHDLYLGTWLGRDAGRIQVTIDGGAPVVHDLYLNDYNGLAAMKKLAAALPGGTHTVEIRALFDKHPASTGYYFYFDYLWPLEPQDPPDPPKVYPDVSAAIDFDTDHGYKKPPAWHVWHLKKLGFLGHADVYMGVFWNNKRRRVGATYPNCTVSIGAWEPDEPLWINLSGTTLYFSPGAGLTTEDIAAHMRAMINVTFPGVWCTSDGNSVHIRSRAPSYTFTISASPQVSITQGTPPLDQPGAEGDWEMIDSISPVMTHGARNWIRDLAREFKQAGIPASFAFSMECYLPPAEMRARYLHYENGVVSPGQEVFLPIPSHQMHFGARVRSYMKQMYKECADEIAAAGLPIVLQFGETQWWYFDNIGSVAEGLDPLGGMPFYDAETIATFQQRFGRQIWPFRRNTDSPYDDIQTANFLRDRIWEYCAEVISYVRRFHPSAVFECLWPLDANQGKPAPDPAFRALNFHVNLPHEWKTSAYGVKYFRAEGFDYDVWQKNARLMRQTLEFPLKLGRPASECMYLTGIYGPPDPPMREAYQMWRGRGLYSFCFWALDQFCLNSRPMPLEEALSGAAARYHKPRAARAMEKPIAVAYAPEASSRLNTFRLNARRLNG